MTYEHSCPIILDYLKEGDQFGFSIVQHLRDTPGIKIKAEAMIYPILKQMEDNKLIQSYWKLSEEGRYRKYYKIRTKKESSSFFKFFH